MKAKYFLNKDLTNSQFIKNTIEKIDLRFISNLMNREENHFYELLYKITPKKFRDLLNIKIRDKGVMNNYFKLINIDKMATLATFYLINSICKNIKKGSYLNIGVWKGFSLFSGMLDTECEVVGVDNFTEFNGKEAERLFF